MKYIHSNGRKLEVRDIGEVIYKLEADSIPLPIIQEIMSDEKAREMVKKLKDYRRMK